MIAVTGASGFIGRMLSRQLIDQGEGVLGIIRAPNAKNRLPSGVPSVVVPDIAEFSGWSKLLRGADVVVHSAAVVPTVRTRSAEEFLRVNIEGTARLALGAMRAGVRRFIFISSAKVHGEGRSVPYSEQDPPCPCTPYSESKCRAEIALREIAQTELETVILRPPLVYGPGVNPPFSHLLQLVQWRIPLPFGNLGAPRSMIYVQNLVDAVSLCIYNPAAVDKTFLLRDGEDLALTELVQRLASQLGRKARLFALPPSVLGGGKYPLRVDDSLIRSTLGWRPPFSTDEGIARTAKWFVQGKR